MGKEGRESETGFSAETVPAASRMTTAAAVGIAGNKAVKAAQETVLSFIHNCMQG